MAIHIENIGDISVMSVAGKITLADGDLQLQNAVQSVLHEGRAKILLDLSGVSRIDSSGVGALVNVYTATQNRGAVMKLCSLPAKVTEILSDTGLITVFEIYRTRNEAIASFR
jgi:anti-sigma B factor antagonist